MAVVGKNIVLDGVYFFLSRDPDILQKILSSSSTTATPMLVTTKEKYGKSLKTKLFHTIPRCQRAKTNLLQGGWHRQQQQLQLQQLQQQ